jgi:hypothetical protein
VRLAEVSRSAASGRCWAQRSRTARRPNGVPPWQVEGLVEDYAHYSRGEASQVYSTVCELPGAEPRDIAAFARLCASACFIVGTHHR